MKCVHKKLSQFQKYVHVHLIKIFFTMCLVQMFCCCNIMKFVCFVLLVSLCFFLCFIGLQKICNDPMVNLKKGFLAVQQNSFWLPFYLCLWIFFVSVINCLINVICVIALSYNIFNTFSFFKIISLKQNIFSVL